MTLLLIGADVRAAAQSARLAGHARVVGADLFGDTDLRASCESVRVVSRYPHGFGAVFDEFAPDAWAYTGGLENHPDLIDAWAARSALVGTPGRALRRVRDPAVLADLAGRAGLRGVRRSTPALGGVLKPLRSAGGNNVRRVRPGEIADVPAGMHLQEFAEGTPVAALFVADGQRSALVGVARQLIGEGFAGADGFRYCGGVAEGVGARFFGPLPDVSAPDTPLTRLGSLLAAEGVRGPFGIDGVLTPDGFRPVEVNPRYTASMELLERPAGVVAAKAIVFAVADVVVPELGDTAHLADLPAPGDRIPAGRPVLTVFAEAATEGDAERLLRARVAEVRRRLVS